MKAIIKFINDNRRKILFFVNAVPLIFLLISNSRCYAQNNTAYFPKDGEIIKDYNFNDVINYNGSKVSTRDYRGKWLILDYWAPGCVGCIESFPKMNKMAIDFKDKANILLVGLYGAKKGTAINTTKNLYAALAKKYRLNMSVAFDSASFNQYGVQGVPFLMIINPKGEVIAKTRKIDSTIFSGFITGQHPPYIHAYSVNENMLDSGYNSEVSLLDQRNLKSENTITYCKSILQQWNFSMPEAYSYGINNNKKGGTQRFELIGQDLPNMLRLAYTGTFNWGREDEKYTTFNQNLILEVKNPERFQNKNTATGEHMYSYSLLGYGTDIAKKRERLLDDLENGIGFKSSIETRDVPIWKIVVTDKEKLQKIKTKGGAVFVGDTKTKGSILRNIPLKNLGSFLFKTLTYNVDYKALPVIIDATEENMNIDLKLPSYFEFDKTKAVLRSAGLDVIRTALPMKCIVVRDSPTEKSK